MWTLLLACVSSEPESISDYSTHAAPTLRTHCTACHGALRSEGGVQLHTLSLASSGGARALTRMAEGSMPPGGGVSQGEIDAFTLWMAQGAPGQDIPAPQASLPEQGLGSLEVNATLLELGPGRFEVSWVEALSGEPFASEVWLSQDDAIFLEERVALDVVDRWEPALRIFDSAQESWTQDVQHSRSDALGEDTWSERWTGESWDALDARAFDKQALGSRVVETQGATMSFQAGERYLVARGSQDPELGRAEFMLVRTEALPETLLEDGLVWTERVTLWP